jgi:hypothetical protein
MRHRNEFAGSGRRGQTITEIGLAPIAAAEFIVIRIVHHTAVEPR